VHYVVCIMYSFTIRFAELFLTFNKAVLSAVVSFLCGFDIGTASLKNHYESHLAARTAWALA